MRIKVKKWLKSILVYSFFIDIVYLRNLKSDDLLLTYKHYRI